MNPDNSIKLPLTTPDIASDRLDQLKTLFPEAFCDDQLDSEKLKQLIGQEHHVGSERYGLTWAGKSDAIRSLQIPSHATLRPMKEESVNFDASENMIIEGDNLEVLKLLQRSYHGKIKMIYIDPPYNTGNDFIYPDNFKDSLGQYLKYSGQVGEDGGRTSTNAEINGRYHSNWLNMMYPRLFLAKNLLKDDGVIFVSIDDNEIHNLRLIMNEIFGEENFIATNVWQKRYSRENREIIGDVHEYIVVYARKIEEFKKTKKFIAPTEDQLKIYKNTNNDPKGEWRSIPLTAQAGHATKDQFYEIKAPGGKIFSPPAGRCWSITRTKFDQLNQEGKIYFGKDNNSQPNLIRYKSEIEGFSPWTWWPSTEVGHTDEAKKEIYSILGKFSGFETPKPTRLLRRILEIGTDKDSIILDFFAGTSTIAQSCMQQNIIDGGNRRFICIQLPELLDKTSDAAQAGFKSIADISRKRVRTVIQKTKNDNADKLNFEPTIQDLGFKAFRLDSSNFKLWDGTSKKTSEELAEALTLFADNIEDGRTQDDMLFEIILKAGQSLTAKIEKTTLGKQTVYSVSDGAMLVCLEDPIQEETLREMLDLKPAIMIALDRAFHGNDQLKTNIKLQAEQSGESDQSRVVFRTV